MIIIGAGIAGAMANGYFSSLHPQVFEARKEQGSSHKAIMRFRDFSIGYLLGVPMEKVCVSKAIFYNGEFVDPNPMVLNLYSKKVSQGIFGRSIQSTKSVERFIAKSDYSISSACYGVKLESIEMGKCYFGDGRKVDYDVCISTIPLPMIAKIAGIKFEDATVKSYPINVARFPVKIPSDIFQTIYFPSPETSVYRASLERQVLIVESLGSDYNEEDVEEVFDVFGLSESDLGEVEITVQSLGKIVDMDESIRRRIITELTDRLNIYSLGRFAVWKNITSDVLLHDLDRIAKMIRYSNSERKYEMRLEVIK